MTTTDQLSDTLAALEAQLAADQERSSELRAALDALPRGAGLPAPKDDLLEPLQMRSTLPPVTPALWAGLRG